MADRYSVYINSGSTLLFYDEALTVPSETHTFANEVVSQTLEDGSPITDHIIVQQDELEVQIFVSNCKTQDSQDTYNALKTIRNKRELCKVYTDHESYDNMAIESVTAPHEAPMVGCLTFTVKFKRVNWTGKIAVDNPPEKFRKDIASEWFGAKYEEEDEDGITVLKSGQNAGGDEEKRDVEQTACSVSDEGELNGVGYNIPLDTYLKAKSNY